MSTFQERLSQEFDDLEEKITKLNNFIESDRFCDLDLTSQLLLETQLNTMRAYSNILDLRISHLTELNK